MLYVQEIYFMADTLVLSFSAGSWVVLINVGNEYWFIGWETEGI
jgi:hypothetical protein